MDKNHKAYVGAQLREFQKGMEQQLGILISELNQALGQLGNSITSSVAAINTLTVQQEVLIQQLIDADVIDSDKFQEGVKDRFELENKRRQSMMDEMRKQQEAIAHADNNTELEKCGDDHQCKCEGCGECEFEAQFEEPKTMSLLESTVEDSEPVLASEKSNVVRFPNRKEEE